MFMKMIFKKNYSRCVVTYVEDDTWEVGDSAEMMYAAEE